MKKNLVINLVIILLAVAIIGGASWAWFTKQLFIEDNSFSSGSVEIELGSEPGGFALPFDVSEIAPGWSETKCLTVTNTGSLDALIRVTFVQTGDSADLGEVLDVEMSSDPAGHDYDGKLQDLFVSDVTLPASGSPISFDIRVSMPGEHIKTEGGVNCINDYQNKSYCGKLVVDAVQQIYNSSNEYQ